MAEPYVYVAPRLRRSTLYDGPPPEPTVSERSRANIFGLRLERGGILCPIARHLRGRASRSTALNKRNQVAKKIEPMSYI